MGSHLAHRAFYGCFVLLGKNSGGKERGLIIIGQFLISTVDNRVFVFLVAEDLCLEIFGYKQPCGSTKIFIHTDMYVDLVFSLHGKAGLCKTVHAERQGGNKQINFTAYASHLVIKRQGRSYPVHHQLITRFMADMHGKMVWVHVILVKLAELGIHIGWFP